MTTKSQRVAGFGKLADGLIGSRNFTWSVYQKDRPLTSEGSAAP